MKVIVCNFSTLNDLHVNERPGILKEEILTRLPGADVRGITIMSITESLSGIPGNDSVFL